MSVSAMPGTRPLIPDRDGRGGSAGKPKGTTSINERSDGSASEVYGLIRLATDSAPSQKSRCRSLAQIKKSAA